MAGFLHPNVAGGHRQRLEGLQVGAGRAQGCCQVLETTKESRIAGSLLRARLLVRLFDSKVQNA